MRGAATPCAVRSGYIGAAARGCKTGDGLPHDVSHKALHMFAFSAGKTVCRGNARHLCAAVLHVAVEPLVAAGGSCTAWPAIPNTWARACCSLLEGCDVAHHGDVVTDAPRQHEQVPDGVIVGEALPGKKDDAAGV